MSREALAEVLLPNESETAQKIARLVLGGASEVNGADQSSSKSRPRSYDVRELHVSQAEADEIAGLSYDERAAGIDQVVTRFKDHKLVKRAIGQYVIEPLKVRYRTDPMTQYFQEISRYPLLTEEDEKSLFSVLNHGLYVSRHSDLAKLKPKQERELIRMTIAYDMIYYSNLRLVVRAAKGRFKQDTSSLEPLDYIQEGNIALDYAIKRFDITKGFKFSTYAMWWLRQKYQRTNATMSRTIHIPQAKHVEWIDTLRYQDELAEELGRQPTYEELANAMKRSVTRVVDTLRLGARVMISLNQKLGEGGTEEIGDKIASDHESQFQEKLSMSDFMASTINAADLTLDQLLHLSFRYRVFLDCLSGTMVETVGGKRIYDEVFNSRSTEKLMTFKEMTAVFGTSSRALKATEDTLLLKLRSSTSE